MPRRQKDNRDELVEAAYYRTCSGIQINIMDISKVFAVGRQALERGEDLDSSIRAYVETIRQN